MFFKVFSFSILLISFVSVWNISSQGSSSQPTFVDLKNSEGLVGNSDFKGFLVTTDSKDSDSNYPAEDLGKADALISDGDQLSGSRYLDDKSVSDSLSTYGASIHRVTSIGNIPEYAKKFNFDIDRIFNIEVGDSLDVEIGGSIETAILRGIVTPSYGKKFFKMSISGSSLINLTVYVGAYETFGLIYYQGKVFEFFKPNSGEGYVFEKSVLFD